MLVGREREWERIGELLDRARLGRSGALLLHGEAGIGKTALLDHAAATAAEDMQVVRAVGVESEAELEFSGLLELCRPLAARLDAIPARQAETLRGALGLGPTAAGSDRFTIGAATLSLLAATAEDAPLLALVDDVQWLDRSSQDALVFAARRLQADRVVLLFARRDGEARSFEAAGLETLALGGLADEAAEALLAASGVSPRVAAQLHAATGGNPLALRELPGLLSAAQLAGSEPLTDPLPISGGVKQAFAQQAAALGPHAQTVLLVAAVATTPAAEPVLRALAALDAGDGLAEAEDAGLLAVADARIAFRHPLVRSAIHQAASPSDLRAAHRALADALGDPAAADQRAWHLAAAAVGPDEQIAAALVATAETARMRAGYAAAASALERAARLTPAGGPQAARLFAAAEAAWLAGRPERASALVSETLATEAGAGGQRGVAQRLAGSIAYFAGRGEEAAATLLDAVEALASSDLGAAVSTAADAVNASIPSADPAPMLLAAERARALAPDDGGEAEFEASLALGYALCFNGRLAEGEPLVTRGVELFAARTAVAAPLQIGRLAWALGWLGRHAEAQEHVTRTIRLARAAGAVASLPYLLAASAWHGVHIGRWGEAYADLGEGLDLAEQIGQPLATAQALSLLTWLHAMRGDADAARSRAEQALVLTRAHGFRLYELLVWLGLGLLEAGSGRWEAALDPFERAARGTAEQGFYVGGVAPALELAEACARTGRAEQAQALLAKFERSELPAVPLQAGLAARCRGLLAEVDGFEAHFAAALELHASGGYPLALARTQLCFGERLRRGGRRVDAREQLRAALDGFERLGAQGWAERAREELRASGETLRRRDDPAARDELTPRELQIALQVAEGATNKEVAAALFLSPKTVEYHLKHVYRKLDIHARAELIRSFATAGAARD
ncbi:MAG TPA: LuxR family transcriptional regulator [Conexibacter sp.]|jgi:DNA-binding CsgD family transcriptional regulator|nr:LuxR family transcriptional regulator [Conexibacter sp.]